MEQLDQIFAKNLRTLRKKKKITQKALAETIGYSEKTVGKWEYGPSIPSVEALLRVAKALDTDIESLFRNPDEVYYLGIDGGGTKTLLKLCDKDGNILREVCTDHCNPFDVGMEKAQAVLQQGIADVCWNVPFSSVVMYAGIAGGGIEVTRIAFREFFNKFHFVAFDNDTDNENIIAAGLQGKDGIALIMGTGVCLYRCIGGHRHRIAGWGHLFDKGGSAYNFGQEALQAYYAALDGSGPKTVLSAAIEKQAKCGGSELLTKLYEQGKKYIASFAPLVFEAAEKEHDPVVTAIIERNIRQIAQMITSAGEAFPESNEPIRVVIAGGITNQKCLLDYLYAALPNPSRFHLEILQNKPVDGALLRARQLYPQE